MIKKITILILLVLLTANLYSNENQNNKIIGAYSMNGELYINEIGKPEGTPLTKGFDDYKPSWSKNNDMLVFFRLNYKADFIANWLTTICVIKTDGTGFKKLTKGIYSDFNPTWTRDGSNIIIFNRVKYGTKSYIYMTKPDANPGDEILISDPKYSEYAHTCTKDGRILIMSNRGNITNGFNFMLTPNPGGKGKYEQIIFNYKVKGLPLRVSISPSETKITYELAKDYDTSVYVNHSLILVDFDINNLTMSNPVEYKESQIGILNLYPRWIKDESAIVYHSDQTGKCQLYMYKLDDKTTTLVSTNKNAEYRFFCGEETPK